VIGYTLYLYTIHYIRLYLEAIHTLAHVLNDGFVVVVVVVVIFSIFGRSSEGRIEIRNSNVSRVTMSLAHRQRSCTYYGIVFRYCSSVSGGHRLSVQCGT